MFRGFNYTGRATSDVDAAKNKPYRYADNEGEEHPTNDAHEEEDVSG